MVTVCPICDGKDLYPFLVRPGVPIHQNQVYRSQAEAVAVTRGDLRLAMCRACGFVLNQAFDPSLVLYGQTYDNTQTCSPSFKSYVDDIVDRLVVGRGVRDADIVEVGCGKGQFLRALVRHPAGRNRGIGFDPSYEGPLSDEGGRLRFERRFYGPECTDVPADVVVCRHVIEHVPRPREFVAAVRAPLAARGGAQVFFETPCVDWILRNQVVWDFFYEHCSLFTAESLRFLFERSGFEVTEVSHAFGGQYLWLDARVATSGPVASEPPRDLIELAEQFARADRRLVGDWTARLERQAARGKVALWGAGAKGVTFANLIDPRRELIDCLVDVNPNKQGGFIPGSGHPIVGPAQLPGRGVASAMLMNPNYERENRALLTELGVALELFQ